MNIRYPLQTASAVVGSTALRPGSSMSTELRTAPTSNGVSTDPAMDLVWPADEESMRQALRMHIAGAEVTTADLTLKESPLDRHVVYLHKMLQSITELLRGGYAIVLRRSGEDRPLLLHESRALALRDGLAAPVAFEEMHWGLLTLTMRMGRYPHGACAQMRLLRVERFDMGKSPLPSYSCGDANAIAAAARKAGQVDKLLVEWSEDSLSHQSPERTEAWCRAVALSWAKEAIDRLHWPAAYARMTSAEEARWRQKLAGCGETQD